MKKLLIAIVMSAVLLPQPATAAVTNVHYGIVAIAYIVVWVAALGPYDVNDPVECDKELNIWGDNWEYLC